MQVCTVVCEDSRDCLGETLETIDYGDQHVLDAAVLDLVHNAQPEFSALVLFEPKPQDFLAAVGAHAERNVDSLISYQPFVADLDPQRVEEDQRVDTLLHGSGRLASGAGRCRTRPLS